MSRLIDADKLMKDIELMQIFIKGLRRGKSFIADMLERYIEEVKKTINKQPTAFDVDKVISNIWDRSELIHIKHNCYDEVEDYIRVTDVSEIVKAGGIDE